MVALKEEKTMVALALNPTRGRDQKINMRVQPRERELFGRAAEVSNKSLTSFMLDAALREAEEVLLDRRMFLLDEAAYRKFVDLLDAPPRRNEKLRKLLATKAPWEE
jgi:uncharacterized protein (DUF1778 family)